MSHDLPDSYFLTLNGLVMILPERRGTILLINRSYPSRTHLVPLLLSGGSIFG